MSILDIPTARAFEPLLHPARYKGAHGGRGSAKSHFFAGLMVDECVAVPGTRAVCVREVQKTLKESAMRLIADKIEEYKAPGFRVKVDSIDTPGGGTILFQGMQDHTAESIKSLEGFRIAWVEEAQTLSARSLELLRPTIRMPGSQIWASWNPRNATDPVDAFFRGITPPPDCICVRANYRDNPWFPAELEMERSHDQATNPVRYGHIWLGEYEPAAIGAIWDRLTLHQGRRDRDSLPNLARIVVAVDPNISNEPGADEAGVVVAALGDDGRGYFLEDGTVKGGPERWARRAFELFDKWQADKIVAEVNQGGEMVRMTLATVRPSFPYEPVHASRGKHVRAEPIAALYQGGQISHVGTWPELENEMCLMTAAGYDGEGSPNRCDAMVWAFTYLFDSIARERAKKAPAIRAGSSGWMG